MARQIILAATMVDFKDRRDFEIFRNKIIKKNKGRIFHNLYFIKAYNDLIKEGQIKPRKSLLKMIQKRSIRTMSGVTPVTVLTKPYPCMGKCIYCPADMRMPKSYLMSQPAAQRAYRQQFNPYTQIFVRLKALMMTGHEISKVELRIIGGTWSAYPKMYQIWFLKRCLQAMNEFQEQISMNVTDKMSDLIKKTEVKSLYGTDEINLVVLPSLRKQGTWRQAVKANEISYIRCIGINIETRPDCLDEKEISRLRYLGVTKVEMGVQTTDEKVQKITQRGHDLSAVKNATRLLKDAGFKVGYHMMPNLPGSTIDLDKKMIPELFENADFQPDYLKIYPCMVVPKTQLAIWHKKGDFEPYDDKTLTEILKFQLSQVPYWCRVDRIARDIPAPDILAGSKVSNIRQFIEKGLADEGKPAREIRSREIMDKNYDIENVKFFLREYAASKGRELFISYEDVLQDKLIALLRLRFPGKTFLAELKDAAIIREIHVYGRQIAVGNKIDGEIQHGGWGRELMKKAESLAENAGFKKIAVIAGIGTREYYRKLGYELLGTYMIKMLAK